MHAIVALAFDGGSSTKGVRGKHSARTQKAKGKSGEPGNVSDRLDGVIAVNGFIYGGENCQ